MVMTQVNYKYLQSLPNSVVPESAYFFSITFRYKR